MLFTVKPGLIFNTPFSALSTLTISTYFKDFVLAKFSVLSLFMFEFLVKFVKSLFYETNCTMLFLVIIANISQTLSSILSSMTIPFL